MCNQLGIYDTNIKIMQTILWSCGQNSDNTNVGLIVKVPSVTSSWLHNFKSILNNYDIDLSIKNINKSTDLDKAAWKEKYFHCCFSNYNTLKGKLSIALLLTPYLVSGVHTQSVDKCTLTRATPSTIWPHLSMQPQPLSEVSPSSPIGTKPFL